MPTYAELHCLSCYSFLRSASHPHELVERAAQLGYAALAITDECSLAGIVKAHVAAKAAGLQLIVGSEFTLEEGIRLVALVPSRAAYSELSGLISMARRRSPKGEYRATLRDVIFHLKRCLLIWLPRGSEDHDRAYGQQLARLCKGRLWLGVSHLLGNDEAEHLRRACDLAGDLGLPMVACGDVRMHTASRKPLHDVFTALHHNTSIAQLGRRRLANSQQHLRSLDKIARLYPPALLAESLRIARLCDFSLDELRYEYPQEVVPEGHSASSYLRELVAAGAERRWPGGVPAAVRQRIDRELELIREMHYEYYFLTVYDIVDFARSRDILCQGRGSAANSVVCYCLGITEVSPEQISLLFERFISKERDEPPDIDVDFEHERREEVIQYIYRKYSRRRAALAATLITYRARSAVRDVGKALGLDQTFVDDLAKSMAWWDRTADLAKRFEEHGVAGHSQQAELFYALVQQILGFPRHLSQHVGGFVITRSPISTLVPVENASMADRTVIQWDKEDIESLGLLKVDILALGMLSAIRKSLHMVNRYNPAIATISDIPKEDAATYRMLQQADTVGIFQIESRAQMTMLPRLKPACFYDLVIEIAIVRPGPIQGDMVHPYLRRKQGKEAITYPSEEIKGVLESTLGVPIFQEQVIKLAMVAAGFSGGEADQLRRAIANWGRHSRLLEFEQKLTEGMIERGYDADFARRLFNQIKGFAGYGFPESHSASFALLAYVSAWLKRHHPAAFFAGLLNSQPMGFYSPSQLLQDARRHHVSVLPVDVNQSDWDHLLLDGPDAARSPILLGLRLVKGLSREGAQRLVEARRRAPFRQISDLRRRAQLDKRDMEALADADALASLAGHRHQSQWQIMALEEARPLLQDEQYQGARFFNDGVQLPPPAVAEEVLSDYRATGLTLRPHPMSLLRNQAPFNRCLRQVDLATLGNNRFVRIAGLVTCRQRPGTASGVLFLTLEDETGNSNIVVWKSTQAHFRQALMSAQLLLVTGTVETVDNVTHVVAGALQDYTHALQALGCPAEGTSSSQGQASPDKAGLQLKSRDFH
ncbi:DNA polymerase III subunit alpha [Pseudohalioglobus sediminis]|uniref:Error-prone DNA polymerase n=1 Tax=Pseudohalioglobus sediminis TaxID=2606449 RepID=A0A5B0WUN1_9GAMM|nr:error-prone DNA polymerase [Pseudohalioglobus sediminis]KAA1190005.1 DNA polymerase III subunit alpha [Pseudohalioglobus sediminis]